MIAVENLSLQVETFRLNGISFRVPTGKYAVLMGKTGCGKTTLLEAICGLKRVSGGSIWLDDRNVTRLKAAERGIGYVPQDAALFSTMNVYGQLAFALKIRKWSRKDMDRRVEELASLLGLENLLNRSPANLSGGEAQRVALGRALACYPAILCLDEPLSNLDEDTRGEIYELLESVKKHTRVTAIHVTHDLRDTHRLADLLFRLSDGMIKELPLEGSGKENRGCEIRP